MVSIPQALDTDTEDVVWALQTAEALWKRAERTDALVWLRRAAQAAGEAEDDDRALALARVGADLAEWMTREPPAAPPTAHASPPAAFAAAQVRAEGQADPLRTTMTDEVEELAALEVPMESGQTMPELPLDVPGFDDDTATTLRGASPSPPRIAVAVGPPTFVPTSPSGAAPVFGPKPPSHAPPPPSHVPSAAEKHAGMLDPWAEGDGGDAARISALDGKSTGSAGDIRLDALDNDEVVTSAPRMAVRADESDHPSWLKTPPSSRRLTSRPAAARPTTGVDLTGVEAFADLPDEARHAFGQAAELQELAEDEEVSGFALALVVTGSVDLAAAIVDTPVQRFATGDVVRARGTIERATALRLVGLSDGAKVATWDERAIAAAFRSCPWVEDDLLAAGNRLQATVGVTLGALGERLDRDLRAGVLGRLTLRVLAEHEVFASRGKPIPGLVVVGAGEIELLDEAGAFGGTVLRPGDFLFPHEALRAAMAPVSARAAKGGAVVLFAERGVAQELLVTCPPLLELFAGM